MRVKHPGDSSVCKNPWGSWGRWLRKEARGQAWKEWVAVCWETQQVNLGRSCCPCGQGWLLVCSGFVDCSSDLRKWHSLVWQGSVCVHLSYPGLKWVLWCWSWEGSHSGPRLRTYWQYWAWRHIFAWAILVAQMVKNLPPDQETRVWSLGWEDPLEKEMATLSSILDWEISWTEDLGGLQFMGSQRIGYNCTTDTSYSLKAFWINSD